MLNAQTTCIYTTARLWHASVDLTCAKPFFALQPVTRVNHLSWITRLSNSTRSGWKMFTAGSL